MSTPENKFHSILAERRKALGIKEEKVEEPVEEAEVPASDNKFHAIVAARRAGQIGDVSFGLPEKAPIGVTGAFTSGVKHGILAPLEILGIENASPELATTSERVSNFLGDMVGLGISFVPFGMGAGLVLRGTGLAAKIGNPTVLRYVQNTLGGIGQGVGMSDEPGELGTNIAIGVGIGAIEGAFLRRSLRLRAGKMDADGGLDAVQAAKEAVLAPEAGQDPEDIAASLRGLFADETATIDDALIEKLGTKTSLRIKEPAQSAMTTLVRKFPQAQILQRGDEFFIHNPISPTGTLDDSARLSEMQIKQWQEMGSFEGLEATYKNKSMEFSGERAAPGFVSIRDPNKRGAVFAVPAENVGIPIFPKVTNKASVGRAKLLNILSSTDPKIGFKMAVDDMLQNGVVDTSEFLTVPNLNQARKMPIPPGTKGLVERDQGLVTGIAVLDNSTVTFTDAVPNLGQAPVDYVAREAETGAVQLIRPSWKNSITNQLRAKGVAESDIPNMVQFAEQEFQKKMPEMLDPEFQTVAAAPDGQFGGCI